MKYEGTFQPPTIGDTQSPFPISGEGSCELDDRCFTVTGFRPAASSLRALLITVSMLVGVLVAVALSTLGASQQTSVGAAIAIFIAASVIPLPANKQREARFRIPWKKIQRARIYQKTLLVSVRQFTPHGEIHFATRHRKQLCGEIARRIAR